MSGPDDFLETSLRATDGLTIIRNHPTWFFRRGRFDTGEAVSLLVREATLAGAHSVSIAEQGDLTAVAADVDWLAGDLTPFRRLVRYSGGGRYSSRIEAAIAAFCPELATCVGSGEVHVLRTISSSDDHVRSLMRKIPTVGRIVAFRPPGPRHQAGSEASDGMHAVFDIADVIETYLEKV